jgi:hypothetical protein
MTLVRAAGGRPCLGCSDASLRRRCRLAKRPEERLRGRRTDSGEAAALARRGSVAASMQHVRVKQLAAIAYPGTVAAAAAAGASFI